MPWGTGPRSTKCIPKRGTNVAGNTKRSTCAIACRSYLSQRPKLRYTAFGRPRPKRMQKRHSICSSKPMSRNIPRRGCACRKTRSNSWHSAYKASRPMSFRRCYGPEYISGLLMHGLRHAAFRSNNPARQAVTECVYRPLQSYGTPRMVGSKYL